MNKHRICCFLLFTLKLCLRNNQIHRHTNLYSTIGIHHQLATGIEAVITSPKIRVLSDLTMKHKKVLVVHYSQTGQLTKVVNSVCSKLATNHITIVHEYLRPKSSYPFPWPIFRFFDVFPESVYQDPPELAPLQVDSHEKFDLIILAYQVWFLAPALPITAFLKSPQASMLLRDRPVVTLIACRNMWLMAQEKMKILLKNCGAKLRDNIVLIDPGPSLTTFITTPRWLLSGNKGKVGGVFPPAGVSDSDITSASRFGKALAEALRNDLELRDAPMLTGLKAATVNPKLIASEKVGNRSFMIWGRILRKAGKPGDLSRKPILLIYICFLVCLIITVVPITMLVKSLLRPLLQNKLNREKAYFELPSGSGGERMQEYSRD